jgi:protease-4
MSRTGFMDTNLPPPINPGGTPPIIVNPPPPPRSCGGWKIFSILLLILLLGSIGLNFLGLLGTIFTGAGGATGAQSGKHFHEVVVDNPNAKNKIAVLEVKGMISSEPWGRSAKSIADIIEDQLKWAADDDEVKAVILKVDSPGGEVMASDDIANAIRKFQDKHKKPVVASMGSLAASGGYYISAPCQWIVCNDLTITGSIGVILHSVNYRGLMDKVGVEPVVFKSGRFKDMLSGSKKPEEQDPQPKRK